MWTASAPSEHQHDPAHVQRAFDRARRVLILATRPGCGSPSVELYNDGSAAFTFPSALCKVITPDETTAICNLIGSVRMMPAFRDNDPDAVAIHVCCNLGREVD